MLEGVEAESGHRRGVGHVPDAEHAALVVELVIREDAGRSGVHALALLITNERFADSPALRVGVQQGLRRGRAARWGRIQPRAVLDWQFFPHPMGTLVREVERP